MSSLPKELATFLDQLDERYGGDDPDRCASLTEQMAEVYDQMQQPDLTELEKKRLALRARALASFYLQAGCGRHGPLGPIEPV